MYKVYFLFCLALMFLSNTLSAQVTILSPPDSSVVEVQPEFPGGVQAFFKYISRKLKYPKSATKIAYHGTVVVSMIVDQDGKAVLDSMNYDHMNCYDEKADAEMKVKAKADVDAEIRKLIANMPTWKPGTQNGMPVRVKYTMPLNFFLE